MIAAAALVALLVLAVFAAGRSSSGDDAAWEAYVSEERTVVERAFGPLSRRFASGPVVSGALTTRSAFESIERDLRTGRSFGASLEVYLSVQLAALIAAGLVLSLAFVSGDLFPLQRPVTLGVGFAVAYLPYSRVRTQATRREEEVLEYLPRFADLLMMVMSSMSVPQALSFAAARDEGPVAEAMRELVGNLNSRALPDREAFAAAAESLGTAYGRDFVLTLSAAYLEGTSALEALEAQAESLRVRRFQEQRALIKRIPVRLVVVFALHFLPMLLALSFLPVLTALSGL